MTESLQRIINGCIERNRTAQFDLYKLYACRMMGVCMWYARNREEAQEILQDGFVRVFTYLHKFNGRGSLEGWIRKVIVNAALQKYNSKAQLRPVVEFSLIYDRAESASAIAMLEGKELMALVQELPPAYRMVFNLYVLEGLKHREIASLLGISEGTSKSNLSCARSILQKSVIKNSLTISL